MEDFKFNNIPSQGTFGKAVSTANKNFELAWVAIHGLEYATRKNKGLFATLNDLKASVPSPKQGEWALVGSSFPCAVYRVDKNGQWVYSGTYEGDNIALNDYVTMARHESDMADLNESIDEVRTAVYGSSVEQEVTFTEAVQIKRLAETIPAGAKVFLSGDVTSLMCRTANTDATYQTVISGTVTDRAINYVTCGATPGTVTITAVIDKGLIGDVEALSDNLTSTRQEFENKLLGVGQGASATLYPVLNLGDFANIGDVNTALNTAFNTIGNDGKQGRLRLTRNGQVIFCDQFAIDYSVGRWAQMAYGMVAPSADGSVLVQAADHPHIVWRMNGADSAKWHELAGSISLKTINGKSLIGEGDITISEAAQIVIDTQFDPTSPNAVANSVVAAAYETLVEAIWQVMEDHDVITCAVWGATQPATAPDGTYAWDTVNKQLYLRKDSVWSLQEKSGNAIYINAIDNTSWRWNGTDMTTLSGNGISISDTVTENDPNPVSGGAVFEALSELSSEIESKGAGVLPFGGIVNGDIDIEGEVYSDEGGTVKYNDAQTMFVLEVPTGALTQPLYYQSWSETATRKPSTSYNEHLTARENVLYSISIIASSGDKLGLYMFNGSELIEASPNLKTINNESILGEGNITIQGGGGDVVEDDDETLYPEYYGAKGDGINYYDWPLRCFRMPVNGESISGNISNDSYALCVWAPGEFLACPTSQDGQNYSFIPSINGTQQPTTEDVVYYADDNCFLLKVGNTYYKRWGLPNDDSVPEGSSRDWQSDNGVIRTDVVFSDISQVGDETTDSNQTQYYTVRDRTSYIMKDGVLTDIETTMTDDTQAIYDCLKANGGSLRLRGGKIYYIHPFSTISGYADDSSTNPFYEASNFVVDGHGGVLFVRKSTPGRAYGRKVGNKTVTGGADAVTISLFSLYNSYNGEFRNIGINAMADRDEGAPGGHYRLSSSGSGLKAFFLYWSSMKADSSVRVCNIRFRNINTKHMYEDFEIKGGLGISIDGFCGDGTCQNALHYCNNLKVRNAYWTQPPYLGDGMHLIYAQTLCRDLYFEDCSFVGPTEYSIGGVTAHGGAANGNQPRGLYFKNCYFEGGILVCETSNGWVFEGCTFRQTLQNHIGNNHSHASNNFVLYSASPKSIDITLRKCYVILNGARLYDNGASSPAKYGRLLLDKCYIVNLAVSENGKLVQWGANRTHVYARDTYIRNWSYANLGFTAEVTASADTRAIRVTTAFADLDFATRWKMLYVDRILHGVTPLNDWMKVNYTWAKYFQDDIEREYNLLWRVNPSVGEVRTDTDALISYRCLDEGVQGGVHIYLSNFSPGNESSEGAGDNGVIPKKDVTIKFSDIESVTVTVNGQFLTPDALYSELKSLFEEKGYTVDYASVISASYQGLIVYQNINYDTSTASISQEIPTTYNSDYPHRVYCKLSKGTAPVTEGETPTWRVKSSGLAETLSTIPDTMENINQTLFGSARDYIEVDNVANLPNDVEAGQLAKVGNDFYICSAEGTYARVPIRFDTPINQGRLVGKLYFYLNPDSPDEVVVVDINGSNMQYTDIIEFVRLTLVHEGYNAYVAGTSARYGYLVVTLKNKGKTVYNVSDYIEKTVTEGSFAGAKYPGPLVTTGTSAYRYNAGSNATWSPYDADMGLEGQVNALKSTVENPETGINSLNTKVSAMKAIIGESVLDVNTLQDKTNISWLTYKGASQSGYSGTWQRGNYYYNTSSGGALYICTGVDDGTPTFQQVTGLKILLYNDSGTTKPYLYAGAGIGLYKLSDARET